ncbi:hypothetical protein MJO28_015353 [Puccinia striiformis f. sp. tritici]|uniref:Uncharacterized protein n=1 Tax=Puccinia striiformis f. sp. tritici TaxID=168172 RepID=A0ACC0DSE4_9BASI|nr:hypothetical protein MJO28_015353 [Puccinia striiformis f. sp. tritici]
MFTDPPCTWSQCQSPTLNSNLPKPEEKKEQQSSFSSPSARSTLHQIYLEELKTFCVDQFINNYHQFGDDLVGDSLIKGYHCPCGLAITNY